VARPLRLRRHDPGLARLADEVDAEEHDQPEEPEEAVAVDVGEEVAPARRLAQGEAAALEVALAVVERGEHAQVGRLAAAVARLAQRERRLDLADRLVRSPLRPRDAAQQGLDLGVALVAGDDLVVLELLRGPLEVAEAPAQVGVDEPVADVEAVGFDRPGVGGERGVGVAARLGAPTLHVGEAGPQPQVGRLVEPAGGRRDVALRLVVAPPRQHDLGQQDVGLGAVEAVPDARQPRLGRGRLAEGELDAPEGQLGQRPVGVDLEGVEAALARRGEVAAGFEAEALEVVALEREGLRPRRARERGRQEPEPDDGQAPSHASLAGGPGDPGQVDGCGVLGHVVRILPASGGL
jgi:hypothetical protein